MTGYDSIQKYMGIPASVRKYDLKNLFKPMLLLVFINSMHPWFTWNNNVINIWVALVAIVSVVLLFKNPDVRRRIQQNQGVFVLVTMFMIYMMCRSNINGMLSWVAQLMIYMVILTLDDRWKAETLRFITKWFAIIVGVCLLVYLLWLFHMVHLKPAKVTFDNGNYNALNYFFFVTVNDGRIENFFRFSAMFLEPGQLTLALVSLIMLNGFKFRNPWVVVLFICEIFTFSLAGIITMVVGYVLLNLNAKFIFKMAYGLIFIAAAIWGIEKAGYGKVLDVFIFDRIEVKNGSMVSMKDRYTQRFERTYENVISSSDVFFGMQDSEKLLSEFGNAGYKVMIIQYGTFGLVLAFLIYVYYLGKFHNYRTFVVTLVYMMLLFQNCYPAWFCMLGGYIIGMPGVGRGDWPGIRKKEKRPEPEIEAKKRLLS